MDHEARVAKARDMLAQLTTHLADMTDEDVGVVLESELLDSFLRAIIDPRSASAFPRLAEFFFANKTRLTILAGIRRWITLQCSFRGKGTTGRVGYASPLPFQFFADAVMFCEGSKPFEGLIGLFRDGQLWYALASRDKRAGEPLAPEDLSFITLEQAVRLHEQAPKGPATIDAPLVLLKELLETEDNTEAKYQELLAAYPWVLGPQWSSLQRHTGLDDRNIPDFTATRTHGGGRDIFEVKPPFIRLFIASGGFSAEFNRAWEQTERYLSFVRDQRAYLASKGYMFDNPQCYLIIGYNLTNQQREQIYAKSRLNPAIQALTYNDLLAWMSSTVSLVRNLQAEPEILQAEGRQ